MHTLTNLARFRGGAVAQIIAVILPLIAAAIAGMFILRTQLAEAHLADGPPEVTSASQTPPKNANGWNKTNVRVEVCAHSHTGDVYEIAAQSQGHRSTFDGRRDSDIDCTDFVYSDDTDFTERYHAHDSDYSDFGGTDTDARGEARSSDFPFDIRIDKTKPVLVYKPFRFESLSGLDTSPGPMPAGTPDGVLNVWQKSRLVVFIMCMDVPVGSDSVMSGVDTNTYPDRLNFYSDGDHTINPVGACTDKAGNVADEPVAHAMVDRRAPTCGVAFNQKAKHGVAKLIRTTVSGTDATSGVASRLVTAISSLVGVAVPPVLPAASPLDATYTGAVGRSWTLTGLVTDNAGNSRSCTGKLISIR